MALPSAAMINLTCRVSLLLALSAPLVARGDGFGDGADAQGCRGGGDGDERSVTGDKVRDFRVRGDRRGVFWLMRAGEWGNVTPPSEGG